MRIVVFGPVLELIDLGDLLLQAPPKPTVPLIAALLLGHPVPQSAIRGTTTSAVAAACPATQCHA